MALGSTDTVAVIVAHTPIYMPSAPSSEPLQSAGVAVPLAISSGTKSPKGFGPSSAGAVVSAGEADVSVGEGAASVDDAGTSAAVGDGVGEDASAVAVENAAPVAAGDEDEEGSVAAGAAEVVSADIASWSAVGAASAVAEDEDEADSVAVCFAEVACVDVAPWSAVGELSAAGADAESDAGVSDADGAASAVEVPSVEAAEADDELVVVDGAGAFGVTVELPSSPLSGVGVEPEVVDAGAGDGEPSDAVVGEAPVDAGSDEASSGEAASSEVITDLIIGPSSSGIASPMSPASLPSVASQHC